jgi:hypothetical protein
MPRFARVFALALALVIPSAVRAQSAAGAAEPTLERRTVTGATPTARTAEPDPWVGSYIGLGGRTARLNLAQLDRVLEPYRATYSRLDAADRARLRQAFDDLIPGQRFTRYRVSEPQARGMVYLALGPSEWRNCDGPRRRGRRSRCDMAIDSMSRDAARIHATMLSMSRTGQRRPHADEVAAVRAMNEAARAMVVGATGCGCPAARGDADMLFASTRDAVDVVQRSGMPAWMSLGDQRVQRIARLSDALERTFIHCLSEG